MLDESQEYAEACLAKWCHTSSNMEFFRGKWFRTLESEEVENYSLSEIFFFLISFKH